MKGVFYRVGSSREVTWLQIDSDENSTNTVSIDRSGDIKNVNNLNHLAIRPEDCKILFTTEDLVKWVKEAYDE